MNAFLEVSKTAHNCKLLDQSMSSFLWSLASKEFGARRQALTFHFVRLCCQLSRILKWRLFLVRTSSHVSNATQHWPWCNSIHPYKPQHMLYIVTKSITALYPMSTKELYVPMSTEELSIPMSTEEAPCPYEYWGGSLSLTSIKNSPYLNLIAPGTEIIITSNTNKWWYSCPNNKGP
jgi:hypothetical protein